MDGGRGRSKKNAIRASPCKIGNLRRKKYIPGATHSRKASGSFCMLGGGCRLLDELILGRLERNHRPNNSYYLGAVSASHHLRCLSCHHWQNSFLRNFQNVF